jgi:type II secretory pathway pseudopilin PulG
MVMNRVPLIRRAARSPQAPLRHRGAISASFRRGRRRAFSIVELLIVLTISATLLVSALVALDALFKRYTIITDAASTNLVARTVMHRILTMVRTGTDFGPYPADVLDASTNPATYTYIEFVSERDSTGAVAELTRIERRAATTGAINGETIELRGPYVLWLKVTTYVGGSPVVNERPMLDGVLDARFNLEYTVGPRLRRATIDLTVLPNGNTVQTSNAGTLTTNTTVNGQTVLNHTVSVDATAETIRLVASTSPRGLD